MQDKILNKLALLFLMLFLLSGQIYASSPGTSIFPFLKITPSARDSAMGEVSSLSGSGSPESNPSVLPWLEQDDLSLSQIIYLQETNYSYLNYFHLMNKSMAFNGSLGYLGMGGLTKTVADNSSAEGYTENGSFGYYDALVNLGFGHKVSDYFSYGVSAKFVQESIDSNADSGEMLSLGGYLGNMPDHFLLGFGVFNIGPKIKGYDLPSGAYAGVGKYFSPRVFCEGEIVAYLDTVTEARAGFEFTLSRVIKLRAGCNYPLADNGLGSFPLVDLTAGLGFNMGQFSFDYAWVPYGDLGQTHRFTLTKKFGPVRHEKAIEKNASRFVAEQDKKTIAVLDLKTNSVPQEIVQMASNLLRLKISGRQAFIVINRETTNHAIFDQTTGPINLTDEEAAVNVGKELKANYMIIGSIRDIGDKYYIAVSQVDVEQNQVVKSITEEAKSVRGIKAACKRIALHLSE